MELIEQLHGCILQTGYITLRYVITTIVIIRIIENSACGVNVGNLLVKIFNVFSILVVIV